MSAQKTRCSRRQFILLTSLRTNWRLTVRCCGYTTQIFSK